MLGDFGNTEQETLQEGPAVPTPLYDPSRRKLRASQMADNSRTARGIRKQPWTLKIVVRQKKLVEMINIFLYIFLCLTHYDLSGPLKMLSDT